MKESLTYKDAYKVMISFLDHYYNQFNQCDLGSVLGSIQLMPDGNPIDPAAWDGWLAAIERVVERKEMRKVRSYRDT